MKELNEALNDLDITLSISKEPYIKELTNDKVINLTGQSGSGKTTFSNQYKNDDNYLIVDTDDIFSEERFQSTTGINKEIGTFLRNKYKTLPNLDDDFDLVYNEILDYCKKYNKTVIIDSAQFHSVKDINILKGKIIILRTCIDECYRRCVERFLKLNPNCNEEKLEEYKKHKLNLYTWYKWSNDFIRKIDAKI